MTVLTLECLFLQLDHQAEVKMLNDRLEKEGENMMIFKDNVRKQFDQRQEQVGHTHFFFLIFFGFNVLFQTAGFTSICPTAFHFTWFCTPIESTPSRAEQAQVAMHSVQPGLLWHADKSRPSTKDLTCGGAVARR